jgi:hypothetical protein
LTQDEHKKLGIELFNATWTLIDLENRTDAQAMEMIHTAHASAYHWLKGGGNATNEARSNWQISRVYAILRMGEAALVHGARSLSLCLENDLGSFDLAFGYEAVARSYALLGHAKESETNKQAALAACTQIADDEDRTYAEGEINAIRSE